MDSKASLLLVSDARTKVIRFSYSIHISMSARVIAIALVISCDRLFGMRI